MLLFRAFLVFLVGSVLVGAAHAQGAGDEPRPAIAPPADARLMDSENEDFVTYPLITDRIAQRGGINGNISATLTVEGALMRARYEFADTDTADSVIEGYEQRLGTAGFDVLYDCSGEACGPTFVRASPGYRTSGKVFDRPLAEQHYMAARRADGGGDVYLALQVVRNAQGRLVGQFDTLRVKPREVGAISVNAEQMGKELDTKGRIALYGIYFNTDSDQIKPESDPTLDEIAKLMRDRPQLRLLVVGHTDSTGTFDYNIDLSTRRAKAVVAQLVENLHVSAVRLKPWGVGYTVPRASNDSDVGQAQNRRVELVIW